MVLVPNISNPFFSKVLRSMQSTANERGYSVLLGDTDGQKDRETAYGLLLSRRQADGLIQLGPHTPQSFVASTATSPARIVHACEAPRRSQHPSIRIDNEQAARTMTQHLIDTGARRIAVITGPTEGPLTRDRLSGWKKGLQQNGLTQDPNLIISGDFTLASGSEGAKQLLKYAHKPDAVFCFNDEMAIGAIKVFKAAGLQIPGDIAVAGFDDIDVAQFCDPSLTTIAQPKGRIGSLAMKMLLDLIENKAVDKQNHVLKAELVIRDSTIN
ncbi:MAG: substrate-binding domain-containing protein [Pseudomonadota bacterium]